jgi:hypothetical protein
MKRMLKKTLLAAAMAFTVTGSFAQEATPDVWMKTAVSMLTRAEVVAGLMNARLSGVFDAISAGVWNFEPLRRGMVTIRLPDGTVLIESSAPARQQLSASVIEARKSGEFARLNAEAFDFSYHAP